MSSRRLRKIQQEKELEEAKRLAEAAEVDEESEEEPISAPARTSLFSGFAALEGDEDQEGEKDDSPADLSEPEPTPAPKAKKSKKKEKAKSKAQVKGKEPDPQDDSGDIEAAIKALNIKNPKFAESQPAKSFQDLQLDRVCKLLSIQTQHLKVANEMRSLFGRTATNVSDDVDRAARRPGQPVDLETALRGQHAPGKGLSEVTIRRNPFIQGKDFWPKGTTGGLTMILVDDLREKDGTVEFRFAHG